eukprot:COSAG05_NODE_349_length_10936_cov_9.714404_7_plen_32_part_00
MIGWGGTKIPNRYDRVLPVEDASLLEKLLPE